MARTLDQVVTETLGQLQMALLQKQAQCEGQAEQIATLKAEIVQRDQTPPDPPASP